MEHRINTMASRIKAIREALRTSNEPVIWMAEDLMRSDDQGGTLEDAALRALARMRAMQATGELRSYCRSAGLDTPSSLPA